MPYEMIGTIALFALMARNSERFHAAVAAAIVVGAPFILRIITFWIIYGLSEMVSLLFTMHGIVTLLVQFAVALYLFYRIKQNENDLTTYFVWVAIGWPLLFLGIPWLARLVL